jgi:hypothetical protein
MSATEPAPAPAQNWYNRLRPHRQQVDFKSHDDKSRNSRQLGPESPARTKIIMWREQGKAFARPATIARENLIRFRGLDLRGSVAIAYGFGLRIA